MGRRIRNPDDGVAWLDLVGNVRAQRHQVELRACKKVAFSWHSGEELGQIHSATENLGGF